MSDGIPSRYLTPDDPPAVCAGCRQRIRMLHACLSWRGRDWHGGCLLEYMAAVMELLRDADIRLAEFILEIEHGRAP